MNRCRPKEKSRGTGRTRREFLLTGGAVMTTLSLGKAQPKGPHSDPSSSRAKIQEIMERYGSELGRARFVS